MMGIVQANAVVGSGTERALKVKATPVCGTGGSATGGNPVLVDAALVDLDDHGDARFNGVLGPLPAA